MSALILACQAYLRKPIAPVLEANYNRPFLVPTFRITIPLYDQTLLPPIPLPDEIKLTALNIDEKDPGLRLIAAQTQIDPARLTTEHSSRRSLSGKPAYSVSELRAIAQQLLPGQTSSLNKAGLVNKIREKLGLPVIPSTPSPKRQPK